MSDVGMKMKTAIQLFINIFKNPRLTKQYYNIYKYENCVMKNPIISFIPPVFAAIITEQCNLRCPTCLYLLENKNNFYDAKISPSSFKTMLEKTDSEQKANVLFLGGGEPLLHPDLKELISIAKSFGFIPKLSTNGVLIEKKIDELVDIEYVNVSIDSYDYSSFLKYRGGSPSQFDAIKRGIKLLRERGINFSLSFLLSSENVDKVSLMIAFAKELKPPMIYFHNINPHGCEGYKSLTMQDGSTRRFLEEITGRVDYPFDIHISTIFDTDSVLFKTSKCIQPWYYFCFNHNGDISYCCHLAANKCNGNILDGDLFNSPAMVRFRKSVMDGVIPASCLYCQRRFMNREYGKFNADGKMWHVNPFYIKGGR